MQIKIYVTDGENKLNKTLECAMDYEKPKSQTTLTIVVTLNKGFFDFKLLHYVLLVCYNYNVTNREKKI